ncbi:hypothetical protein LX36DRAFT_361358 [Colletotrichum falcatum]|nr:hypothetical protein LX36DRAFT_361358 [Colletotrichum falcatum]
MKSEVKAQWAGHVKGWHWWGRSVSAGKLTGGSRQQASRFSGRPVPIAPVVYLSVWLNTIALISSSMCAIQIIPSALTYRSTSCS